MDKKKKLLGLLGSAVLFGITADGSVSAHAGEGKCAGMKGKPQQTKEASCGGMKKEKEKKKEDKKPKEMTCGGNMKGKEAGKS